MENLHTIEKPPGLNTIKELLIEAKAVSDSSESDRGIVKEGIAFGDHIDDTQTKADELMSEFGEHALRKLYPLTPIRVVIENKNDILTSSENPAYSWYIDPLDGSLNREKKGNTLGLPYSFALSVFEGGNHTYEDYVAAGVIDLRSGDTWVAQKGLGTFVNGVLSRTSGNTRVDLGNNIGIAEGYYPFNRYLFAEMFSDQKGWLRSPGSAAIEMAKVAHGEVDFFISAFQKTDVLGTGFAILSEAGGFACDMYGNPLNSRTYDFKKPIEQGVILAASKPLAQELVERYHTTLDKLAQRNKALKAAGLEEIKLEYPKL